MHDSAKRYSISTTFTPVSTTLPLTLIYARCAQSLQLLHPF